MPTILDEIVAAKHLEIEAAKARLPESELRRALADAPPVRDFLGALSGPGPIRLIAEVKKASPSKGLLRADFEPVATRPTRYTDFHRRWFVARDHFLAGPL